MPATAEDYLWVRDVSNRLFPNSYCLTIVLGLTDDDLFERLGVDEYVEATGVGEVANTSMEWLGAYGTTRFVAVAPIDDGALMIEPNGLLGITPAVVVPLSEGREVVSHFRNVNAHGRFLWLSDGDLRVAFDPMFPNDRREGSTPDALVDEMNAVGFRATPSGSGASPTAGGDFAHLAETWMGPIGGAFALAERVTGVAVTRELLDASTFYCGEARPPC